MPDVITIDGQYVARGEQKEIILNIARLPTHTMIDLPIYVYAAEKNGATLLVSAGLHGDEINGIEVIRRMIQDKTIIPTAGTVIAIPIVNIYAFIYNSRNFPDHKDMNRSFPGSDKGSLAKYLALLLETEILPHIDCGVDFHTGGASKMNYPHIRCEVGVHQNLEFAQAFSPPFIVTSKPPDHSFRKSATLRGKSLLTFEGGESLRLDEFSIQEGIRGILRLMKHLGMKSSGPHSNNTILLKNSWWNRAKYSGLFRVQVEPGQAIRKNQTLGFITDPFGDVEYKIKAGTSGHVIGINNMCVVNKGEALIHIGSNISSR
ncbi:succinylglutamate desuccinylase/aspartoacylase family protein [candidate division KSB1 bacterium]|nr:succinylglutamate desuccinylase/aspartoacylase family protein [candidate division KSB1 bacterium]RQW01963.1 MAG: succinylglutamate desuccinylase/aspartoacylase family protein [candidate division KSB1 bacterium]